MVKRCPKCWHLLPMKRIHTNSTLRYVRAAHRPWCSAVEMLPLCLCFYWHLQWSATTVVIVFLPKGVRNQRHKTKRKKYFALFCSTDKRAFLCTCCSTEASVMPATHAQETCTRNSCKSSCKRNLVSVNLVQVFFWYKLLVHWAQLYSSTETVWHVTQTVQCDWLASCCCARNCDELETNCSCKFLVQVFFCASFWYKFFEHCRHMSGWVSPYETDCVCWCDWLFAADWQVSGSVAEDNEVGQHSSLWCRLPGLSGVEEQSCIYSLPFVTDATRQNGRGSPRRKPAVSQSWIHSHGFLVVQNLLLIGSHVSPVLTADS